MHEPLLGTMTRLVLFQSLIMTIVASSHEHTAINISTITDKSSSSGLPEEIEDFPEIDPESFPDLGSFEPDGSLEYDFPFSNENSAATRNHPDQGCIEKHTLRESESIHFVSPNYPESYPQNYVGVTCFRSPRGTAISFKCNHFNVKYEQNCAEDYLGLALNGNPHSSFLKWCGTEPLSARVSYSNRLAVILRTLPGNYSSSDNYPFGYKCVVKVVERSSSDENPLNPPPPPPPSEPRCTCGQQQSRRIVGGISAERNEFPWRCFLRVGTGRGVYCGCSVISDEWVMTAAHCVTSVTSIRVVLGAHIYNEDAQVIPSSRILIHPRYRHSRAAPPYDIALIKLSSRVNFSRTVTPVCLPWNFSNDDFRGSSVVTSGWGDLGNGKPGELRKASMTVLSQQQCRRYNFVWQFLTNDMICAFGQGRGICSGDSGGSIDMLRDDRYYALGISSWGIARCNVRYPSVFARVTSYLAWIQTTTSADFCKP